MKLCCIGKFALTSALMAYASLASAECETVKQCAQEAVEAAKAAQVALNASVPTGAVVAFDLKKCSSGWSEYDRAYGRFVRGIDRRRPYTDPDGERNPGDWQDEAFKAHHHTVANTAGGEWPHGDDGGGSHLGALQPSRNTSTVGGKETRPKNVALLYCRRN
jgi:hypothetical protein